MMNGNYIAGTIQSIKTGEYTNKENKIQTVHDIVLRGEGKYNTLIQAGADAEKIKDLEVNNAYLFPVGIRDYMTKDKSKSLHSFYLRKEEITSLIRD